jgi:hypothetical protein
MISGHGAALFFRVMILQVFCIAGVGASPEIAASLFSGRKISFDIPGQSGASDWKLVSGERVLASGKTIPSGGGVKIETELPPLKDGVAVKAELILTGGAPDFKTPVILHSQNIFAEGEPWPFPSKPAVWPQDSERSSKLIKTLESQGLKAEQAGSLDSFDGDVLLVTGTDFDDSPGMFKSLLALADKGVLAVVLSPRRGALQVKPALFGSMLIDKGLPLTLFKDKLISADFKTLVPGPLFVPGSSEFPLELKISSHAEPGTGFRFARFGALSGPGAVVIIAGDFEKLAGESPVPLMILKDVLKNFKTETQKEKQ